MVATRPPQRGHHSDKPIAYNGENSSADNGEFSFAVDSGVNSLVTMSSTVSEDFKKILIVETIDQIKEDISTVFKSDWISRYKNTYDNQILFLSSVNGYFRDLALDEILDPNYDNRADVDVESQRSAWLSSGKTEAEDWDEQKVKNMPFRSMVFLSGLIKIPDAIEDLQFSIELQ